VVDEHTYERELGGINEKLAFLLKGQDDMLLRFNELTTHGCARGVQNAKDIDDLKHQPSRVIATGAAIIASVVAVLSWLHRG
jgi:ABC-type Fe2+-enterobactin transport system substrate-binding protein